MASRTQIAGYLADNLSGKDRKEAVKAAASWLLSSGRARQAKYLARDVAQLLAKHDGYVWARVTTARPLNAGARAAVEEFIKRETGAKKLELEMMVDPSVIGGARIEVPGAAMDGTLATKLAQFVKNAADPNGVTKK